MIPITARVAGDLILENVPPRPTERLRYALRFPNEKYQFLKRRNLSTGIEPEFIEAMVEMPDRSIWVPRGAVDVVRQSFLEDGYTLAFKDERAYGWKLERARTAMSLRDYQEESVAIFQKHLQGIVEIACGGGKTRIGVAVINALGISSLVIVPSNDLADQWRETLKDQLQIEAGTLATDPVCVVVEDNLLNRLQESERRYTKNFGLVIVDEAHHIPSKTLQKILRYVPAKYRLGLTATNYRGDGADPLIAWTMGRTLFQRSTKQLIAAGWLMPAEIEILYSDWEFDYRGPEKKRIAAMERELVSDLVRNTLIADRAANDARQGETVLILCGRKTHTKELAEMIGMRGVNAVALTSASTKKKRTTTIASLKAGELPVMVATSLADEGLDVTRLSRVILAFPQKARGATMQRLGRLLRDFPGKKPKLIDVVDRSVPALVKRADERRKVYREADLLRDDE